MKVPGAFTGETHFTCNIVSKEFEGKVSLRLDGLKGSLTLAWATEADAAASNDICSTKGRA